MKNKSYGLMILWLMISIFSSSCSPQPKAIMTKDKRKDFITDQGKHIISAPIVYKNFVKKSGEILPGKEMYIQRSIKDYYIKFCDGKVTRNDIERHLSTIDESLKTLTFEVEFLHGEWDICDGNSLQQTRIGDYVIIHRIVE